MALNQYLLPDLRRAGFKNPLVETLPSNPSDTAASNSAAPLVVQRLKAAGVKSVIPLIPFNSFFPFLSQENGQNYFPKLLLSDYESSINVTLGLIPIPYEKGLDHQEGVTVETLGGTDAPTSGGPGRRIQRRGPELLRHLERAQQADLDGLALHRGAGPDRGMVPGHPTVRGRRPGRGAEPQPAYLRPGHVADPELLRAPTRRP